MKIKLLFIITIFALTCGGCNTLCDKIGWFCEKPPTNIPEQNTLRDVKKAKEVVEKSSDTIEKATEEISTEANKITSEATEVQRKVPEETKIIYLLDIFVNKT